MKRTFYTKYPENLPTWYWEKGLHDACVIGVQTYEFPFDYNKYVGEKNKYDRNMLTLKIDAELGNLQKTLNEAKNSLSAFMKSGEAPKGLEKAFEKINTLLGQISDKTGKPLDLKGLTSTQKD